MGLGFWNLFLLGFGFGDYPLGFRLSGVGFRVEGLHSSLRTSNVEVKVLGPSSVWYEIECGHKALRLVKKSVGNHKAYPLNLKPLALNPKAFYRMKIVTDHLQRGTGRV